MTQWLDPVGEALAVHGWILWVLGGFSLLTLLVSVAVIPILIVRIPADYYVRRSHLPGLGRPQWQRVLLVVVRNLLGAILLVAGIAMLFLPGQGLLTILAALALLDFPFKRELELALLRSPGLSHLVQWIRRRGGVAPLVLLKDTDS